MSRTIPPKILAALGPITPATLEKAKLTWAYLDDQGLTPSFLWGYGPNPEHNNRRCLDIMCYRVDGGTGIDRRVGDVAVRFLWDHASAFGLRHLIWRQRVISTQVQPGVWRGMATRPGGVTANHYDHVHVNFGSDKLFTGGGGSTAPVPSKPTSSKLKIDGQFGPATTRRAQRVYKSGTLDGIVSNQTFSIRDANPGLRARDNWEFNGSRRGSDLIREIQRNLKRNGLYADSLDGLAGPNFWRGMQKWLGTKQDGKVSEPSDVVAAFQRWLNQK